MGKILTAPLTKHSDHTYHAFQWVWLGSSAVQMFDAAVVKTSLLLITLF